ncbi:MAG: Crp/Fnr family transcriptional regulator [Fusobacterium sp.]|uniref:Crp/Fnr family transcriptional regulator n=1 Tax=Fusobacterium sp. TaxID=68766 RepID=UPI0029439F19|nr:Crp/Fnr family transcriptional regulator [Fusobacterium sp.]MDY3060149.1 Crp/Fnr family transcriptional regulator [Fusobacterium sp.]
MTFDEVLAKVPQLNDYLINMPKELKSKFIVKIHPPGTIIHHQQSDLDIFGIVATGEHRVINIFENGNIFMIEKNEPIDFIGEVTILAGMRQTSVTIETITESIIMYISREDFEEWIKKDIHFLYLVSQKVALKLYRSSSNRGAKLFYPPTFLLLDYLIQYAQRAEIKKGETLILKQTREELYEEVSISVKTLNRTISKLKQDGVISIIKGKIAISYDQYKLARKMVKYYVKQDVKNS